MIGLESAKMFIYILALVVVSMTVFLVRRSRDGIPGPRPKFIIGNLTDILPYVYQLHRRVIVGHLRYGYLFKTWLVKDTVYHICHPADNHKVLISHFHDFDRNQLEVKRFHKFLGGGIILRRNGTGWKKSRSRLESYFLSTAILRKKSTIFQDRCQLLIDQLHHQMQYNRNPFHIGDRIGCIEIDMEACFQKLTFDAIGLICMDVDFKSQLDQPAPISYHHAWKYIVTQLNTEYFFPFPYWKFFTTKGMRYYQESMQLFDRCIEEAIRKKSALLDGGEGALDEHNDILSYLLKKRYADPSAHADLSDSALKDELFTLLFAGHDTTTNLLAWAIYYIASDKEVYHRVIAELEARKQGEEWIPNVDDIRHFKYLKWVIMETLRLKPSAPLRGRTTLQSHTLNGYDIPQGSTVVWSAYATHHHPDFWANVDLFDPSRFERKEHLTLPCQYIPFGAGPRKCIGEKMAYQEALIVLSGLLWHFEFCVVSKKPPKEHPTDYHQVNILPEEKVRIVQDGYHPDTITAFELAALRKSWDDEEADDQVTLTMSCVNGMRCLVRKRIH